MPGTPAPTEAATQQPTSTKTRVPTQTSTPVPTALGGGSGRLIFELSKQDYAAKFRDLAGERNVFIANLDSTDMVPVTQGFPVNSAQWVIGQVTYTGPT